MAVKVLPVDDEHTQTEVDAFVRLRASGGHVNVVKAVIGSRIARSPKGGSVHLPLELCNGTLMSFAETRGGLEEGEMRGLLVQIVAGLSFLHAQVRVYVCCGALSVACFPTLNASFTANTAIVTVHCLSASRVALTFPLSVHVLSGRLPFGLEG